MRAVFSAMRRSLSERRDRFSVVEARRAQHEPLGLEDGDDCSSRTADSERLSSSNSHRDRAPCTKAEEGSRHPGLPLHRNPCGSAGSTGCRRTSIWSTVYSAAASVIGTYRYVDAAFGFGAELDVTVDQREQRVVLAQADIAARMPLGAALARDDVAGDARLRRRKSSGRGAGCWSRGRCARSRLLSCEPWLVSESLLRPSYTGFVTKSSPS